MRVSILFVCAVIRLTMQTSIQTSAQATLQISSQSTTYVTLEGTAIPTSLLIPPTVSYNSNTQNISSASNTFLSSQTTSLTTDSDSLLGITGPTQNATRSSSRSRPTVNAQPCNGHVEFCNRKFSNVSMVVAHNSPFVVPHNIASNQDLVVLTQLNDGVRGLQTETHMSSKMSDAVLELCHTSCSLLDAGTLESYLKTVHGWLSEHRFEVITIIMGNDDRVPPSTYIAPFQNSGMLDYVYIPPKSSMTLDDWPTFAEMIIQNTRVVVMLDYLANQTEVPWLLDMFSYQWQTPFSPTDPNFPCTEQRPQGEPLDVSKNKMYLVNHNLNIPISISGDGSSEPILIPAYTLLNDTNAVSGNASLGNNVDSCTATWGRPPNWLLVDYYNYGNFNGSVFQVAADANNVTYNRASCCGTTFESWGCNAIDSRDLFDILLMSFLVAVLVL